MSTTVLYVCHNHPELRPGGAEAYALELYKAMREQDDVAPIFLARGGPPLARSGRIHPDRQIGPAGDDDGQYYFYGEGYRFDDFIGSMSDKRFYSEHFRRFLQATKPDVVHFQHTWMLGFDMIREVRRTLPDAVILYTLHEFLPICYRNGQMVRTFDDSNCSEASPRRCHECFPHIKPQEFFLRKNLILSHLSLVDRFIAPSRFLRDRYVQWGLSEERVVVEDYGRSKPRAVANTHNRSARNRIGFFGQLTEFKGADVLLEAMLHLEEDPDLLPREAAMPQLRVHGANLDLQRKEYREKVEDLCERTSETVRMMGRYSHDSLPALMEQVDWVVVPSVWWENSPLVIQEAFIHGRPVICSNIGGMAEKVTDGVDGLHFAVGDPLDLARVLARAVSTEGLWDQLHAAIPGIYDMTTHVQVLAEMYQELMAE